MEFYKELKALCKKYDRYAVVYSRAKDRNADNKRHFCVITETDEANKEDIQMTLEAVYYLVSVLMKWTKAKDKARAASDILSIVASAIGDKK